MSEHKYEVGGQIQDARGKWYEVKAVYCDRLHVKGLDYVVMPQFIRDYRPPSRTVREWIETLPDGIRERALRNMKPNNAKGTASSLDSALCYAFAFGHAPEEHEFWWKVLDSLRDQTPFPAPPDLGYGTDRLTGEPIQPPEGMEIVPEGEAIGDGAIHFRTGFEWETAREGPRFSACVPVPTIRAYARPIRQRRKAKPPELWRIGETGAIVMALEKTRGANITDNCLFYSSEGFGEHKGDTFVAPSIEAYYRDGYVKIEDVRRAVTESMESGHDEVNRRLNELGIKEGGGDV